MTDRKGFIGASDCAAVLGMSRYKTPLQVWSEKTGELAPDDISEKLQVKLGNRLEEVVAELFTEKTGKKVRRVIEPYAHKQWPFIQCHIDRKVVGEDSILQCKTTSPYKAKEWEGEEIPQEYILQEIHELAVTGCACAYIAVLIGNHDFKIKTLERSDPAVADMVVEVMAKEVAFWNDYVLTKKIPVEIKSADTKTLYRLFPEANVGDVISLNDNMDALIENIQTYTEDMNRLKDLIEQQRNELKRSLGDAEAGETDKYFVSWKNQHKDAYTVKASDARILRIKEKREKGEKNVH